MSPGLRILAVVVVLAAAGVGVYFVFFAGDDAANRGPGGSLGEIFVDSPEIYTRERLVNDRFREDAWLKDMLTELSKEDAALQGFVRTSARDTRSVEVSAGTAPPAGEQNAAGDKPEPSAPPATTASDAASPDPQTILRDRFERYLDIRDAIRKQIVENQLDDRHDLSANTLYAFKFDVTVLPPGNDTSAWAKVAITISESDQDESGLVAGAKERLYHRWVSHLETVTNEAYLEQNKPIGELSPEYKRALLAFALSPDVGYDLSARRRASTSDESLDQGLEDVLVRLKEASRDPDPLSLLIAKWVMYDQIFSRKLERYVDVSEKTLAGSLRRIVVSPRIVKTPVATSGFEFEEAATLATPDQAPQTDGLVEFRKLFVGRSQTLFTYSVSPRISVENLADTGSSAATRELTSKLQASNEIANVDTAINLARQLDSTAGAIRRNALIVGFADRKRANEKQANAVFGWYIGPRFQLSDDGHYNYRQVPNQYALSALIALPAGWPEVRISVRTEWIREDGSSAHANAENSEISDTPATADEDSYTYYIDLPTDPDKVTAALSIGSPKSENLGPIVYERQLSEDEITLQVEQPGAILIPGRNLWRSTVVTVGAQASDRITVLPNMEGIIAHFDEVLPAYVGDEPVPECTSQIIRVWTSTGLARLDKMARVCRHPADAADTAGEPQPQSADAAADAAPADVVPSAPGGAP